MKYLIALPFLSLLTSSALAQTTYSVAMRGDIGDSQPADAEKINLSWTSAKGKSTAVTSNTALKKTDSTFSWTVPAGETLSTFTIRFTNDRVWQVGSTTYDRNVRLNMASVKVNGTALLPDQVDINGPAVDSFDKSGDTGRLNAAKAGVFAWQNDYVISLLPVSPARLNVDDAMCADPANRLVCFKIRGDQGDKNIKDQELMRLSFTTTDGATTLVYKYEGLPAVSTLYGFQLPANKNLASFKIEFMNDYVYNDDKGNRVDRNIRLDTKSVSVVGTKLVDVGPYITGSVIAKFIADKDADRTKLVRQGIFAWQNDYVIPMPVPADPCQASFPGELSMFYQDSSKNAKSLCLSLRSNTTDSVRILYQSNGKLIQFGDLTPLTNQFTRIPIVSDFNIDNVRVQLQSNKTNGSFETDLGYLLANRGTIKDGVPCADIVSSSSALTFQVQN